MQEKWIIFLTITKLLFINPSIQAELLYQNEWECINEILENHKIIQELLKLNDEHCTSSTFNIGQFIKDIPDDQDISFDYDDPNNFNIIEVPDLNKLEDQDTPISEFNQKFMGIKLDKGDFLNPTHNNTQRKNLKIIEDESDENSSQENYQKPLRQKSQNDIVVKNLNSNSQEKPQKRIHEKITFVEPEINMPNTSEFEESRQTSEEKPKVEYFQKIVHKNIDISISSDESSEVQPIDNTNVNNKSQNDELIARNQSSEDLPIQNQGDNNKIQKINKTSSDQSNNQSSEQKPEVIIEQVIRHKDVYLSISDDSSDESQVTRSQQQPIQQPSNKSQSNQDKITNPPQNNTKVPIQNKKQNSSNEIPINNNIKPKQSFERTNSEQDQQPQKQIIERITWKEPSSIELPSSSEHQSNDQPITQKKSSNDQPIQNNLIDKPIQNDTIPQNNSHQSQSSGEKEKYVEQIIRFKPVDISISESSEQSQQPNSIQNDLPIVQPTQKSTNDNIVDVIRSQTKSIQSQSSNKELTQSDDQIIQSSEQKQIIQQPQNKISNQSNNQPSQSNQDRSSIENELPIQNRTKSDQPIQNNQSPNKQNVQPQLVSSNQSSSQEDLQNSPEKIIEQKITFKPVSISISDDSEDESQNVQSNSQNNSQEDLEKNKVQTPQQKITNNEDLPRSQTSNEQSNLNDSHNSQDIIQQPQLRQSTNSNSQESQRPEKIIEQKIIFKPVSISISDDSSDEQPTNNDQINEKPLSSTQSEQINHPQNNSVPNSHSSGKQNTSQISEQIQNSSNHSSTDQNSRTQSNLDSEEKKKININRVQKPTSDQSVEIQINNGDNLESIQESQQTQSKSKNQQTQSQDVSDLNPQRTHSDIQNTKSKKSQDIITIQKVVQSSQNSQEPQNSQTQSKDIEKIKIKPNQNPSQDQTSQTKSNQNMSYDIRTQSNQEPEISSSQKRIQEKIKITRPNQNQISQESSIQQPLNDLTDNSSQESKNRNSQTKSQQKNNIPNTMSNQSIQSDLPNSTQINNKNKTKEEIIRMKDPSTISLISDDEDLTQSKHTSQVSQEQIRKRTSQNTPSENPDQIQQPDREIKINFKPVSLQISDESQNETSQNQTSQNSSQESRKQIQSSTPSENPDQIQQPDKETKIRFKPVSLSISDESQNSSQESRKQIQSSTPSENPDQIQTPDREIKINFKPVSLTVSDESQNEPSQNQTSQNSSQESRKQIQSSTPSENPDQIQQPDRETKIRFKPVSLSISDESQNEPSGHSSTDKIPSDQQTNKPSKKSSNKSTQPNEDFRIKFTPVSLSLDSSQQESSQQKTPTRSSNQERSKTTPESNQQSSEKSDKSIKIIVKVPSRSISQTSHSEIISEQPKTRQDIILSSDTVEISLDTPPKKIIPNLIPNLIKKEKNKQNNGPGYTYYAIQHRVQRLLESDERDRALIIEEILLLFNLLPECIKKIFEVCNIDMQKVKQRCDSFHLNLKQKCNIEKTDLNVVNLSCNENEEKINDTCVQKCPNGFTEMGYYCLKGQVFNRFITQKNVLNSNLNLQHSWGDQFEVKPCTSYGKYYRSIGSEFCGMICPEGWQDSGLMCEKPKRFINQPNFVFSQKDIKN